MVLMKGIVALIQQQQPQQQLNDIIQDGVQVVNGNVQMVTVSHHITYAIANRIVVIEVMRVIAVSIIF